MSPSYYIVLTLVSLIIGLSKGGMGAVLVVLATPLLSQVMPVPSAISLTLPLLLIADVVALWMYRGTWSMYYVKLLLPFAVIGIIVGTYLLATLPNDILKVILACFSLAFVAYKVFGDRLLNARYQPREWHGYLAGGASGLGSALANTGAPPFTAYMLLQNVTPQVFVGTMTLFFAIVNLLKVPGLMLTGLMDFQQVLGVLWVVPVILFGVWLGRWIIRRINQIAFERFMLVVLVIAAIILLVN